MTLPMEASRIARSAFEPAGPVGAVNRLSRYEARIKISWIRNQHGWMDAMACLEDGCPQVPGATCYQDNVLFIVVLQGSSATTLSPSDLSIIQPEHEGTASGLQV